MDDMACDEMESNGKWARLEMQKSGILITAHLTSTKLIVLFCCVT